MNSGAGLEFYNPFFMIFMKVKCVETRDSF